MIVLYCIVDVGNKNVRTLFARAYASLTIYNLRDELNRRLRKQPLAPCNLQELHQSLVWEWKHPASLHEELLVCRRGRGVYRS